MVPVCTDDQLREERICSSCLSPNFTYGCKINGLCEWEQVAERD
jgi:hypothetical protein